MDGSPSQLMERLRRLIRQDNEVRAPLVNSTPTRSMGHGESGSILATPEIGSNMFEDSSVEEAYVTSLSTNFSLREVFRQDYRLRIVLVLTLCFIVSLSCAILMLTLKINYLQTELAESQKFCTTEASMEAEVSITAIISATLDQGHTKPLAYVSSTPPSSLSAPKFSGKKDVNWDP